MAIFLGPPGEPVPEENFWTLWCKGRLTETGILTIRLGSTPSGLTSAYLHHPPINRNHQRYQKRTTARPPSVDQNQTFKTKTMTACLASVPNSSSWNNATEFLAIYQYCWASNSDEFYQLSCSCHFCNIKRSASQFIVHHINSSL